MLNPKSQIWSLIMKLYVVLVVTLPSHCQGQGEGRSSEDTGLLTGAEEVSGPGNAAPVSSHALLGSVIKLGGGILGIAGKLAHRQLPTRLSLPDQ